MDVENFAEPVHGPRVSRLSQIARSGGVWLIAGVPTRDAETSAVARNSALLFNPAGELSATYHKQRLFAFADEERSYQAGTEAVVVEMDGVRVAPFICYDLRFPELFRRVAAGTDLMVVIASWPAERRMHWDVLLAARAIENQCYVVGVNRTGNGGTVAYDGGSIGYDPWGAVLPSMPVRSIDGIAVVTVSASEVGRVRAAYPFLADASTS
jgi:predicted amidohydrolase